jgi:glycosyltransferase involved in cell wall biosynthesis
VTAVVTRGGMTMAVSRVVVTPVYEDVEASSRLFRELRTALGSDIFIVAVDDGSVRQPVSADAISAAGLNGVVLRLKRNVGHQRAIATGLAYVAEHLPNALCVVMDSDGEDLPSSIPALFERLEPDTIDIAVAQRKSRVESLRFKAFYALYKLLFQWLTGHTISFGNFMALKPAAVRRLAVMPETGTHIAGTVLISKLRLAICPLDRGPRYAGQSKMNFTGLVLHGFRAMMILAEDVLLRTGLMCMVIAGLSIMAIVLIVLLKAFGLATPGWFSVALGILLLVLFQTSALTLMMLMLTGVVRGASPIAPDYKLLVDHVLEAHGWDCT